MVFGSLVLPSNADAEAMEAAGLGASSRRHRHVFGSLWQLLRFREGVRRRLLLAFGAPGNIRGPIDRLRHKIPRRLGYMAAIDRRSKIKRTWFAANGPGDYAASTSQSFKAMGRACGAQNARGQHDWVWAAPGCRHRPQRDGMRGNWRERDERVL